MPENLAPFLQFSNVQSGPNHQASGHTHWHVHLSASFTSPSQLAILILTASVRGTIIGTGTATTISPAKRVAATRALQHLCANGIPDDMSGTQWPLHMPPIRF